LKKVNFSAEVSYSASKQVDRCRQCLQSLAKVGRRVCPLRIDDVLLMSQVRGASHQERVRYKTSTSSKEASAA
jgi:hypothetical protein